MKFSKSNRLFYYINRMKFLINCDLGEVDHVSELENDKMHLQYINMANIACGGHAGSDEVMIELLKYCKRLDVLPGAHPSYPDRQNFGRTKIPYTTDDIRRWTFEQVHRLAQHASTIGVKLHHIKPHGALYHDTMNDIDIAEAFIQGFKEAKDRRVSKDAQDTQKNLLDLAVKNMFLKSNFKDEIQEKNTDHRTNSRKTTSTSDIRSTSQNLNPHKSHKNQKIANVGQSIPSTIHIVGQSDSKLEQVCIREGLPFLSEAFADRKYLPTGALQSRAIPGSVLNSDEAIEQVKSMMSSGTVNSTNGPIPIRFDTVCVHGDSPGVLSILESISKL